MLPSISEIKRIEQFLIKEFKNPDSPYSQLETWQSLFVDYHPPFVERLWIKIEGYRFFFHRILPCTEAESLFHPHPWASAVHVIEGHYFHVVGYSESNTINPTQVAAKIESFGELYYEMTQPNGWHSVVPMNQPTISTMLIGELWERWSPKPEKKLDELNPEKKAKLFQIMKQVFLKRK